MSYKKKQIGFIILFIIGISILLYPAFSTYYAKKNQGKIIHEYVEKIKNTNDQEIKLMREQAKQYNEMLKTKAVILKDFSFLDEDNNIVMYENLLNKENIMGYVKIDKINVYLPIYYGTSEEVLKKGVGHLKNTSLPIGGPSTHAVLSAHSGSPSAVFFNDLDTLKLGDTIELYVLDNYMSYKVDQIKVVDPDASEELKIVEGKDYLTLATCTPYGKNTHRLLIRGSRVLDKTPKEPFSLDEIKLTAPLFGRTGKVLQWTGMILSLLSIIMYFILNRLRKKYEKKN